MSLFVSYSSVLLFFCFVQKPAASYAVSHKLQLTLYTLHLLTRFQAPGYIWLWVHLARWINAVHCAENCVILQQKRRNKEIWSYYLMLDGNELWYGDKTIPSFVEQKQTSSLSFWGRLAAPSSMIFSISVLSLGSGRELRSSLEKTFLAFCPQPSEKACSSRDAFI